MRRWLVAGQYAALALALAIGVAAWPGEARAADDAAERAALAERRRAVEARFQERQQRCAERFAVTPCVERARTERREALAEIGARESALDDAERQRRAAARLQRLDEKTRRRAERDAAAAETAATAASDSAAAASQAAPASAPAAARRAAPPPPAAPSPAERAAQEQRARAAYTTRQREAEARRAAAARREAEQVRKGRESAAPLPPVESSAPR